MSVKGGGCARQRHLCRWTEQEVATHQVDIRDKVAVESCRDAEGPDAVTQRLPDVDVKETAGPPTAAGSGDILGGRQQGAIGEASQHQHKDEHAKDAQRVLQAHFHQQARQHEGQRDGEDTAAGCHDAVDQTQAPLEVVAQDDQAGLVAEGAAACKYYSVGEVQESQGPARRGVRGQRLIV